MAAPAPAPTPATTTASSSQPPPPAATPSPPRPHPLPLQRGRPQVRLHELRRAPRRHARHRCRRCFRGARLRRPDPQRQGPRPGGPRRAARCRRDALHPLPLRLLQLRVGDSVESIAATHACCGQGVAHGLLP